MLNKKVLAYLCCATMLFPVWSARAQDQAVFLPDLPVALEPQRIQNLMLLSAAQNTSQPVPTHVVQEQARAVQQAEAGSEEKRRQEELRRQIHAYGPPYRGRVDIWLRNGRKLTGTIAEISSDSFLLQQKKNKRVTVSYSEVAKGPVVRSTAGTEAAGEGAAMVLVLAMYVTARVLAYNSTHQ